MITDQCSAFDLIKEIEVLAAGMELYFFHWTTYWTVIPSNINAGVLYYVNPSVLYITCSRTTCSSKHLGLHSS